MTTIMVDPDDDVWVPISGWKPKRDLNCLDDPIREEGEPCALNGHPCILYGMWDMAEDWSREFVNPDLHPYRLIGAPKLTVGMVKGEIRRGAQERIDQHGKNQQR